MVFPKNLNRYGILKRALLDLSRGKSLLQDAKTCTFLGPVLVSWKAFHMLMAVVLVRRQEARHKTRQRFRDHRNGPTISETEGEKTLESNSNSN